MTACRFWPVNGYPEGPNASENRYRGRGVLLRGRAVNPSTGARTLISGNGRGSGPALVMPATVAVEASGYILVTDVAAGTGNQRVLQIDPATGNRIVLTGAVVGSGPAVTVAAVGLENGGDLRDGRRRQPDHVG